MLPNKVAQISQSASQIPISRSISQSVRSVQFKMVSIRWGGGGGGGGGQNFTLHADSQKFPQRCLLRLNQLVKSNSYSVKSMSLSAKSISHSVKSMSLSTKSISHCQINEFVHQINQLLCQINEFVRQMNQLLKSVICPPNQSVMLSNQ